MNKAIIAQLLVGHKEYAMNRQKRPEKSGYAFFSVLTDSMYASRGTSSVETVIPLHGGLPPIEKPIVYLERLKRELMIREKPLKDVSLSRKDLLLLEKLLVHCGFSQEKVQDIVDEIDKGNSHGEINLSAFFDRISELYPFENERTYSVILEPSAIPHLESALRDIGLTSKEIADIFDAARIEGGGLNLTRFLTKLRPLGNTAHTAERFQPNKTETRISQLRTSHRMPSEDHHIENAGRASIRDLIAALEKAAKVPDKKTHLHPSVKATIEQIVEKAGIHEGTGKVISPALSFYEREQVIRGSEVSKTTVPNSQPDTDRDRSAQLSAKAIGKIGNKSVINEKDGKAKSTVLTISKQRSPNQPSQATMSDKGSILERERLVTQLKDNGGIHETDGDQKPGPPLPDTKVRLFSDGDSGKRAAAWNKEDTALNKPDAKAMNIVQSAKSAPYSDIINTVMEHKEKGFLPTYVIDQIGRGISRSLQRADRIIRLQLNPPELGALKVEMDMKGNNLKLSMITENNAAKELLLANVHELREALVDQGVKLERLDVHIHCDINQFLDDSHEGHRERPQGTRIMDEAKLNEQRKQEDLVPGLWGVDDGEHVLDLVA